MILLLAVFLRVYRLDMLDLRYDEASGLQNARNVANGMLLLTAPFSGSVVEHPPVYAYTMAIPYLFTADFLSVVVFRILLDVAAVGALWVLCMRTLGLRAATIAALCFAVAPWAVQFARKTWLAPLPIYQVLLLWGLVELVYLKRARGWAITGWGLALSVGAHLSALYLAPAVVVAIWLGRRSFRWKHALLGALPLLVLASAWLAHDAAGGFTNLHALFGGGTETSKMVGPNNVLIALMFAAQISGGMNLGSLTSAAFVQWQAQAPLWLNSIDWLNLVLVGCGLLMLVVRVVRPHPQRALAFVLLVWIVGVVGAHALSSRPLQPHYMLPLLPIPFIAIGMAGAAPSRLLRAFVVAVLMISVPWHMWNTIRFVDFVALHDTSNGGYGPPVRAALTAANLARARVRSGANADVIVVTPGGDPAVNEQAAIMDVLLSDVPHRFARAEDGLILRGDGAQYLFTPGAEDALVRLREVAPLNAQRVSVYDGDVRAYVAVDAPPFTLNDYRVLEAQWEGGARLIGYRAQRIGSELIVDAYVSVVGIPAGDVHWFARTGVGDVVVASTDIGGIAPAMWRVGDLLALRFRIALPSSDQHVEWVRLGAYAYPQIRQLAVLDAAGNPADDGVTLMIGD
ncbi:MAG: glycosyltransferase family 39 protein [Chloroflexi bacterium]|nr:glycosyltransferase family 39 protein [Chloroflexota bacterium]